MKNSPIVRVLLLLSLVVLLSGCFDVAQHITRDKDGNVVSIVRFTFDKSLFSITEQMGGEAVDYDSMLSDADLTEDQLLSSIPPRVQASYEPINNPARFGFSTRMTYSDHDGAAPFLNVESVSQDDPALKAIFFPYLFQGGVAIPFEGIEDADEESEPFLASSVYAISIGKPLMSSVSEVHVVSPGQSVSAATRLAMEVDDYEDYFLLEIPLSEFIGEGTRIVVVRP